METQNTDPTIVGTKEEPQVCEDSVNTYLEIQNAKSLEL